MRFLNTRVILGLVIIFLGVVALLERLGYTLDISGLKNYWPLILLVIGLNWIINALGSLKKEKGYAGAFFPWGRFLSGTLVFLLGIIYLGVNLEIIEDNIPRELWKFLLPAILIIIGISLLRGKTAGGLSGGRIALMGGIEAGKAPWKLESSSYLAFMGGVDLDLTTAEIPDGETVLDLTAIMGGIDVKIPSNLPVIYEGTAVLGGVTFLNHEDGGLITSKKIEHRDGSNSSRVLRLQARAFMGGIEIKAVEN